MGWFYFKIKIVKSMENPLMQIEYANNVVKYVLLPSLIDNNNYVILLF